MTGTGRTSSRLGVVVLAVALVLGAGCGSGQDDGSGTEGSTDVTTTGSTASRDDLAAYDDIADLHQALLDGDIACALSYEGLRDEKGEVSLCVIEGEQALLTVWDDPETVADFAESDAARVGDVAHGFNWTVDVDSPETARHVADALGGRVSG